MILARHTSSHTVTATTYLVPDICKMIFPQKIAQTKISL